MKVEVSNAETTVIDRRVMLRSKWQFSVSGTIPAAVAVNQPSFLVAVGTNSALAPLPAHQLFSTVQATVNNNTVNLNCQDVINAIVRSSDMRELQVFNSTTPIMFDTYADYGDALLANNNPLAGWNTLADNDLIPRGSYLIKYADPLVDTAANTNITADPVNRTVNFTFETYEPLLVSPFIFNNCCNGMGIYGVQNLNFTMNVGSANRFFRTTNSSSTVILTDCKEAELIFNFITPHPSDLMPSRNVVPYYELPRYISKISEIAGGVSPDGVVKTVVSANALQLNQVPDKLFIFVRKQLSAQRPNDPDAFMPISKVSIQWNNQSGILASATQDQLYRYSREAGSNQNWLEFQGFANKGTSGLTVAFERVLTSGSMLMLDFAKHIQITEDYYAPGSIGNFNLQLQATVDNYTGDTLTDYELVIITMNSGLFVCERGTSSIYTAILTKDDVLQASSQQPYGRQEIKRIVGGGFLDSLKSLATSIVPKVLPVAKQLLSSSEHPVAKLATQGLSALGYGSSGGAMRKHSKLSM
jgi:hypothetical protein